MQRYELFFIQPNIYTDFNTKDINLTSINENMEIEEEFTQILTFGIKYIYIMRMCMRIYNIYNIYKETTPIMPKICLLRRYLSFDG